MKKTKAIEALWTLMILMTIVISSFYLLILGATSYQNIIEKTDEAEMMRLPILYLSTAVKQADKGQISVIEQSGTKCLKIAYEQYSKLIYEHEGFLKELLVADSAQFSLSDGELIAEVEALNFSVKSSEIHYEIKVLGVTLAMQLAMR